MYPIDVPQLVRRGALGALATDPTLPHRPSRRSRLRVTLGAALQRSRRTLADERCGAEDVRVCA